MRRGLWPLALAGVACAGGIEDDAALEELAFVRAEQPLPKVEELALPGVTRAIAVRGERKVFGGDAGLFEQRAADAPVPIVPRVLEAGEPETVGAVRAIAERANGHLFVASERGLFVWNERELLVSPITALAPSPVLVAATAGTWNERIAMVEGGRLLRFGPSALELRPASAQGEPAAIAFQETDLFVAYGELLVRLAESSTGFTETAIPLNSGRIFALQAAPDGALWVGAEHAVLRRRVQDGVASWQRWQTDDTLLAMAPDPDGAGCWVRTRDVAMLASTRGLGAWTVHFSGRPGALALDLEGNLWAADGAGGRLERQGGLAAPPPSFAEDVAPFAHALCASCHGPGQSLPLDTYEEWQRNAQRILLNLRAGTMPRGSPLQPRDFRVIERWVAGGMLP